MSATLFILVVVIWVLLRAGAKLKLKTSDPGSTGSHAADCVVFFFHLALAGWGLYLLVKESL